MRDVARNDLVILDEFGYVPLDLDSARLLFQGVSDCYERHSLVITTNIEFSKWAFSSGGERFPDTEEVTSSNLVTPTI